MALTEREIFSSLSDSLTAAAECCDDLVKVPRKGPTYIRLRSKLRLIEGAARQAAHFREDSRWLKVGMDAHSVHEKAGGWLRSHAPTIYFAKLAVTLRKLEKQTVKLRDSATGRTGVILPKAQPIYRENRPVFISRPSGLIIPASQEAA